MNRVDVQRTKRRGGGGGSTPLHCLHCEEADVGPVGVGGGLVLDGAVDDPIEGGVTGGGGRGEGEGDDVTVGVHSLDPGGRGHAGAMVT